MNKFYVLVVGIVLSGAAGASIAQSGHMMNGGFWGGGWMGGYGGMWLPTLLVIVVVALVLWVAKQKK